MKEVDLSTDRQIGMQGFAELAKTIVQASGEAEQKGKCIRLQRLSLRNCNIASEDLTALSPALTFIEEVVLSTNMQMERKGMLNWQKLSFRLVERQSEKESAFTYKD